MTDSQFASEMREHARVASEYHAQAVRKGRYFVIGWFVLSLLASAMTAMLFCIGMRNNAIMLIGWSALSIWQIHDSATAWRGFCADWLAHRQDCLDQIGKVLLLCLLLPLTGCATRLYQPGSGKILASFGGRYQSIHFAGAGVVFDATQMSHATETNAVFNGATKVTTALGTTGVLGSALP